MSDNKWTKGPWVVNDTHPDRACLYISSPDDLYKNGDVATVYCAGTLSYEQDAQLIAAAPDLAEEHQQWSEEFGQALMAVMQEDYGPITELAMRMPFDFHDSGSPTLRSDALAKARGES